MLHRTNAGGASTDDDERTGFDDRGKDVIVISDSDPDDSMVLASSRINDTSSDSETELRLIEKCPVHCLK